MFATFRTQTMAMSGADRSKRFRLKNKGSLRDKARDRMRASRAKAKAEKAAGRAKAVEPLPQTPSDQAGALFEWARTTLITPPGHHLEGRPMEVPAYGEKFLRDALAPDCRDSLLCMGRKGGKTAIIAITVLAHLVGPLRRKGWRCGVASLSRDKANELRNQIEAISLASGLKGIQFWRRSSPAITTEGGSVDVLSADRNSGAAAGFDLVLVDELGLLQEKDRALVNSLRASLAAKHGRFVALTIHGSGPFVPEFLARKDHAGVAVHLYQPPADSRIDDEAAWHQGNPGLGSIKNLDHMREACTRVLSSVGDQSYFRAEEMNLPGSPGSEMVCSLAEWSKCVVTADELPERTGSCVVGFDLGGSSSMTALAAIWPNGRCESWAAFPGNPTLQARARADGARYGLMQSRGELKVYAGRITPVGEFLRDCAARLAGERVVAAAAKNRRCPSDHACEPSE